ncbi:MAG: tRNA (guanosine(46)-N7)-methyltransferase TrmB [Rickettsiales bacterium]|nr:MAG: tRNA (guanosine(46)-N7)-methyltransferase TrmB [Rickettsiales bacterium]
MEEEQRYSKLNRTFARRIGKSLSNLNKDLLSGELPKYSYSSEKLLEANRAGKKTFLEIGFGMGEHFLSQLANHPDAVHIGVEVYLNGVANVLKQLEHNCAELMLWPDDIDLVLEDMPEASIDGIYVLFPDPWHKRRYLKKRMFNKERVASFGSKLKAGGFIIFASDIEDYFDSACDILREDAGFVIEGDDFSSEHAGYVQTKYHQKAIREGRRPQFVKAIKR